MAVMGFRLAQRANGVSELHGHVAREMFSRLWPGFDEPEVPIGYITNGVHAPTWVAPEVLRMAGPEIVESPTDLASWDDVTRVPDADIWAVRGLLRARLVADARQRVRQSWVQRGASEAELGWVDKILDPDVLTIGFARRVPSYKRLTLMLRDQERLTALLRHPERPIQIVIAGKAHPADDGGKKLIQELVRFADTAGVRDRIIFLPNYDIAMAQKLYPGCDVWLNNPLRPLEACGTSGMKAALNGCLNLSVLDGWWDEMYDGHNGWAIPTADGVTDPDHRDDLEAAALYELLEKTVAPLFYDRDADGLPARWIEMVRHTLQTLGPQVLATRMVRDYVLGLYAPGVPVREGPRRRLRRCARARGLEGAGARGLAVDPGRPRRDQRRRRRPGGRQHPRGARVRLARPALAGGRRRPGRARPGRRERPDHRVVRGVDAPRGGLRGRAAPVRRQRHARPAGPVRLHRAGRPAPPPGRQPGRARSGRAAGRERRDGLRRPAVAR